MWSCCWWVNARKNGWKETDQTPRNAAPTAMTDGHHVQWVKSVFEHMCCILCTSAALKKLRRCIPWLHFNGWRVMDAFIWPSAETTTAEQHLPMSPRRKYHGTVRVLWKSCMPCSSAEMDLCMTIPCPYFCWLLQDKVRPAVCHKQPELLEHGAIFTRTMQQLIAIVMCKIWCSVGAGRCWYILASLQISHHVIIGCLYMWDNHVQGKRFESEDCINTAVTASLCRLSKDECRAGVDCCFIPTHAPIYTLKH